MYKKFELFKKKLWPETSSGNNNNPEILCTQDTG